MISKSAEILHEFLKGIPSLFEWKLKKKEGLLSQLHF